MNRTDSIYVALINVPAEMCYVQEYNSFVEIRAEILAWEDDEPKFEMLINNMNILMVTNVQWDKFAPVLDTHVTEVFKERKADNTTEYGTEFE